MRKLVFSSKSDKDQSNFKFLMIGFIQGGNNLTKEKKDRTTIQLEARIRRKFDEISEEDSGDLNLPWRLKFLSLGNILTFTDEEYQTIDRYLDAVAWPTAQAIQVAQMFDFWGDASREAEKVRAANNSKEE